MPEYLADAIGPLAAGVIDPDDVLDYAVDFTDWLDDGETISSYTVTVTNATKDSDSESSGVVTVWLSAAQLNTTVTVKASITTSNSRQSDKSFTLKCRQR